MFGLFCGLFISIFLCFSEEPPSERAKMYQNLTSLSKNLAFDEPKVKQELDKQKTRLQLDSEPNATSELPLDNFSPAQINCLLLISAFNGDHARVEALMTKSTADTYLELIYEMNALHLALIKGHAKCVTAILKPGRFQEDWLQTKYQGLYSPLHLAVYFGHVPCLKVVLASACDRRDVIDSMNDANTCTPLHIAAMLDSVEAGEVLLKNGADIEGREVTYTPLLLAAQYENCEMTHWLLEKGADWNSKTPEGVTALALIEYHVPEAMTAYLDNCIELHEPEHRWQQLTVKVDSSRLTTRPNHMTGSLLSDFKQLGCYRRLEHPVCQLMLSCIGIEAFAFYHFYLFYCVVVATVSIDYLRYNYGCICITKSSSSL